MKNIFKKATALLLSLLMVFSVCSTALVVYAAESEATLIKLDAETAASDETPRSKTITLVEGAQSFYYIAEDSGVMTVSLNGLKGTDTNIPSGLTWTVNGKNINKKFATLAVEKNDRVDVVITVAEGNSLKTRFAIGIDEYDLNYVSIGDSMTNGYGFKGYNQAGNKPNYDFLNGIGVYGQGSYADTFATYLDEWYDVNHTKLALSGLRAEDLAYLLGATDEVPADGYFWTCHDYARACDGWNVDPAKCAGHGKLIEYYQNSVENADIISLALGNASFNAFFLDRVMRVFGVMGATFGDELAPVQPTLDLALEMMEREEDKKLVREVYAILMDELMAAIPADMIEDFCIDELCDLAAYTAASFVLNYIKVIEKIVEINPKAKIILVGVLNSNEGMRIKLSEDNYFEFGSVMGKIYDALSSYIAAVPTVMQLQNEEIQNKFYFVEQPENPELIAKIVTEVADAGWGDYSHGENGGIVDGKILRAKTVLAYCNTVRMMLESALNQPENAMYITLNDIEAYEADPDLHTWNMQATDLIVDHVPDPYKGTVVSALPGSVCTLTGNDAKTLSIVIYLALEEAVLKSLENVDPTIDIDFGAMGTFLTDLGSVFAGAPVPATEAVMAEVSAILTAALNASDLSLLDEAKDAIATQSPDALQDAFTAFFADDDYTAKLATYNKENRLVVDEDGYPVYKEVNYANDGAMLPLVLVFAINQVGNGISAHPTPATHDRIFEAMKLAYESEYTVQDKVEDDFNHLIAHINARYDEAYAYAWAYAKQNGYIDAAIASIDAAIAGIDDAIAAVKAYDTVYVDVKAALIAELEATKATLESIKPIISTDDVDNAVAQIITLAGELDAHFENIKALATAIGVEIDPYIATAINAANTYAELVDYTVKAAYEWLVNNVIAINDAYITFVEETGAYADEIDPALGVAVRKFLYETPADTIAIIAAYGEEAVALLISTAAATAKDLYAAAGALANTIKEYGPVIYNAIVTNKECKALYELVVELTAQIAALALEAEAAPIGTAYKLYAQIDALKANLNTAATQLYVSAIEAVNIVDPVASEALTKSLEALCAALELVDGTVIGYFDALDANAIAMGGKLLAALAANWDEFASVAGPIIDGKIWMLIDFVKEYITNYDYNALLDKVVAEAIKLAPQVDEALYDYFYNNPEEVIAFFEKYGPCMIELAAEYGDIALGVVGVAFYMYGEDMVDYIVNNPKEVVEGIIAWADKYGERTAELLQVYAEATGLCDIVRGEIAVLEGKLEQLQAELVKQYQILEAQIKPQLEALYKQLDEAAEPYKQPILDAIAELELQKAVIEKYIAELQGMIEVIIANIDVLNVKLQNLVAALYNLDDAIKALVEAGIEAGIGAVAEALDAVGAAVVDLIGVVSQDAAAQVDAFIANAKELLEISFYNATHADYKVDKDSYYVAFGNGEYVEGFAALIAEKVKENGVSYKFNDLTSDATISALLGDITANIADVAKADLISIGYNLDTIAENTLRIALELIMIGETTLPTEFDWEALAGADAAAEIEKVLAEVYATLIAQGLDKSLVDMGLPVDSDVTMADAAYAAVEYFAYNAVEYAIVMPQAVYAINEINPDALIMINAISNPLAGAKINLLGLEFAFGDYLNYVCDALYVETLAIAALNENVVFVPATKVETTFTNKTIGFEKFSFDTFAELDALIKGLMLNELINATEEGNAYIAEQMFAALNITVESTGLLGDVNGDGKITSADAVWILRYVVKMLDQYPDVALDFALADVNADGVITSADAVYILRYTVGLISSFDEAK